MGMGCGPIPRLARHCLLFAADSARRGHHAAPDLARLSVGEGVCFALSQSQSMRVILGVRRLRTFKVENLAPRFAQCFQFDGAMGRVVG